MGLCVFSSLSISSYYHNQIGNMNHQPLFRVRSWNNGMRCLSCMSLWRHGIDTFSALMAHLRRTIGGVMPPVPTMLSNWRSLPFSLQCNKLYYVSPILSADSCFWWVDNDEKLTCISSMSGIRLITNLARNIFDRELPSQRAGIASTLPGHDIIISIRILTNSCIAN